MKTEIPTELLQNLINYLVSKVNLGLPYHEVAQLVKQIQEQAKPVAEGKKE